MAEAIVFGCGNVGLGAIHGLAKEGVRVVALPADRRDFAQYSRHVARRIAPPLIDQPTELLQFLASASSLPDGALLLPTTDATVAFSSQNYDALSSRFAVAAHPSLERLLNKGRLYDKAAELGVDLPLSFEPRTVDDLEAHRAELSFPCLLKPTESHRFQAALGTKLFVVESFDQLRARFLQAQQHDLAATVAELIPGDDTALYHYRVYIDSRGRPTGEACSQKIRQHPPHFGAARVSRTVPMLESLRQPTLRLLQAVGYRGFASAEYKRDRRDGRFKLMEINVRQVLPIRLFEAVGVNFAHIVYLDLIEQRAPQSTSYQQDVHWIDLYADLWNLLASHREEKISPLQYVRPYLHANTVYCQPFSDPWPCGIRMWQLARSLFKQIAAKGITHTFEVQRCE